MTGAAFSVFQSLKSSSSLCLLSESEEERGPDESRGEDLQEMSENVG
jgi:hypothetical protein